MDIVTAVNEIQLIRGQLHAELHRAVAVAEACAEALAATEPSGHDARAAITAFRRAGAAYLARVLGSFAARDQRLGERYRQLPLGESERRAVEKVLAGGGSSLEAREQLEQERWQELFRFVTGPWKTRRDAIDRALESRLRVADWRALAGIDADSILEERRLYAQVRQHRPPGTAAAAEL